MNMACHDNTIVALVLPICEKRQNRISTSAQAAANLEPSLANCCDNIFESKCVYNWKTRGTYCDDLWAAIAVLVPVGGENMARARNGRNRSMETGFARFCICKKHLCLRTTLHLYQKEKSRSKKQAIRTCRRIQNKLVALDIAAKTDISEKKYRGERMTNIPI